MIKEIVEITYERQYPLVVKRLLHHKRTRLVHYNNKRRYIYIHFLFRIVFKFLCYVGIAGNIVAENKSKATTPQRKCTRFLPNFLSNNG